MRFKGKKRAAPAALALCMAMSMLPGAVAESSQLQVDAGLGYYSIGLDHILLTSQVTGRDQGVTYQWSKLSGPGDVEFQRPEEATTYATATEPGQYVFQVAATDGNTTSTDTTTVNVYEEGSGYGNPILPGLFPDPHVYYDEVSKMFYIFATSMDMDDAGAYGRATTWKSKDFVNWEMTLNNWPVEGEGGWGSIWAPEIIRNPNNGKYYQFITNAAGYNTWVGVSDSLDGPWENARETNTPLIGGVGSGASLEVDRYNMDSHAFVDDDGQAYVYWGWAEPMVAKLSEDFTEVTSDVTFLKGTKWVANGGDHPQWAVVDLQGQVDITKITTSPEFRNVVYQYKISTSTDGQTWSVFADRSANTTTVGDSTYVDEGNATARYVKFEMLSSSGHWASLYDLSVYAGDEKVSLNKPVEVSSYRQGDEGSKITDSSSGPALEDFVEASYMVKHDGKYYLLYSSGALHDGTYSVHYSVADDPMGPFVTPENNVVLQSNAEQTTKGPGHNSVMKFGDQYYIIYHQHNQPHTGGGGVFRQTAADVLEFNEDGTIRPVEPTQTGVGALLPLVDQGTDLAQGKYAQASSQAGADYGPCYALDHNNASLWKAADNTFPQSLTVDLEQLCDIERVETTFEYPTQSYKYKIETSVDQQTWETYVDHTQEFPQVCSPQKDVKDVQARYVKITIVDTEQPTPNPAAAPANGAGLYAFEVYGSVAKEEADKQALTELVDQAKALQEGDYTPASWENLAQVLGEAEALLTQQDATQEQVDEMVSMLQQAMDALEPMKPQPSEEPEASQQPQVTDQPQVTQKPEENVPQTGDTAQLGLWLVFGGLAAAMVWMGSSRYTRRRRG